MNKNNHKDFIDFIQEETKSEQKQSNALKVFLRLVPEIYQKFVTQTVEKYYGGDVEKYKKSIPLFIEKFTFKDKDICDKNIIGIKKNKIRKLSKLRKQTILWAGQLLKLVGKNAMEIVPYAVLNQYMNEQNEQVEFCRRNKLMNARGKLVRLTTPQQRKEQRNAQNYKIAKLQEKMAKDRGFTFAFITLTLPPEYHPNPTKGHNSYQGARPQEAVNKLNEFWELIRANLAKKMLLVGEDFFGMQVVEGHKDSCLHKHILVHIAPENLAMLQEVVKGVETREREKIALRLGIDVAKVKLKFDFKINNGKAKASTYLFKYISPDLNNKSALKNEAVRSAYGVRSFSFFGVQNKLGTFNHLVKNWQDFKGEIDNKEVIKMLEDKDLNLFYSKYHADFENVTVKNGDKYEFIGVSYIPNRLQSTRTLLTKEFEIAFSNNDKKPKYERVNAKLHSKEILITKKQFVIVENEDQSKENTQEENISIFNHNKAVIDISFPLAQKKQKKYNELLLEYYKAQSEKLYNNFIPVANCYYSDTSENIIKMYFDEQLEEYKEIFQNRFEDTAGLQLIEDVNNDLKHLKNLMVILKHRYSSKNTSCFSELEKPSAKAVRIE